MPQSLADVVIHIVFSTKQRFPFLAEPAMREEMHAYLGGACKGMESSVLIVGGTADHVHILCSLSRNTSIAKLVGEIKASSSKWVKSRGGVFAKFAWQTGYGVFSIGRSEVQTVRDYIGKQERHHQKRTFREEYLQFLEDYGIQHEERYLWD